MGQKTNPIGLRLGIIRMWESKWFAKRNYRELLKEDIMIRNYIRNRLRHAAISRLEVERTAKRATVSVYTARPGVVIGRRGAEVDLLRDELQHLTQKEIVLNIQEIKFPELDAQLVADNIARQIEQRVAYRRVMKKAVANAMRLGAKGVKIECKGRLAGAEMARTESYREGRVPLHTLRADIDYATSTSHTTYGCIGVKVWIFKGEVIVEKKAVEQPAESQK